MKSLASVSDVKNGRGQNITESIDPFETIGLPGRQAYNFPCLHWFSAHVRQAKRSISAARSFAIYQSRQRATSPSSRPSGRLCSDVRPCAPMNPKLNFATRGDFARNAPSIPRTTDHEPMTSWIRHGNDIKSQSASRGTHRR